MQPRALSQDDFLIDAKGVAPIGTSPLDQLLRERPTCIRGFDNKL